MIFIEKLKVLSLFSGIGAFESALERLKIDYELVGFSEIDKYAITAYSAIHNVDKKFNLGDIGEVNTESIPNCDLITYGFPCQDISIAGNQKGIIEGETRSGLLYEALRIIDVKKPKYAIAENVKNLVGKKFRDDFESLLNELGEMGYNSYWQVLNAKDYGIPQNRERVFIISIRKDMDDSKFEFPRPFDSELRLKDFLEDKVEERYYLSSEYLDRFISSLDSQRLQDRLPKSGAYEVLGTTVNPLAKGTNSRHWVYDTDNNISTIDATTYKQPKQILEPKVAVREATKKGYDIATVGDSINIAFPNSQTRRGRVGKEVAQTLETGCNQATLESDYKIRKLTPLECWRLMGFDDEDYWEARKALEETYYNGGDRSNSQMYKMAGNSIVVNVLVEIYKNLFEEYIIKQI